MSRYKRRLAFAAVAVFGVAVTAKKVRRHHVSVGSEATKKVRNPVYEPLRLVLLLPTLMLAIGIPNIEWPWDYAKKGGEAVVNFIKDWVVDVITFTAQFLIKLIGDVRDILAKSIRAVSDAIGDVNSFVIHYLDVAEDFATAIGNKAQSFASYIVGNAMGILNGLIDEAKSLARFALDSIGGEILKVLAWVKTNVLDPLYNQILSVIKWVNETVIKQILDMFGDLIRPIKDLLDQAWAEFKEVKDFVVRYAKDAVNLVFKVWDFLTFVATHPFTWWRQYADSILTAAPDFFMSHVSNAVASKGGFIEDFLTRLIQ